MTEKDRNMSRRDFISMSGAGLTSLFALSGGLMQSAAAQETPPEPAEKKEPPQATLPTRSYGKTGVAVSMLALGGIFDIVSNQVVLKKSLDCGLTYWDTADCYEGGNSEIGIGKYFEKFSDARKKIFLVTKSDSRDPEGVTKLLNRSLERMKTDYIDLYFLHGVKSPGELSPEIKAWAEKAKADGRIKFFGFSAHENMADLLQAAAGLGWIDGIMMRYNFRLMHENKMKAAVEACQKAGVGLTAMMTQGGGPVKTDSEAELKLAGHFLHKGYTSEQAKIKAVWQNEAIASVCSQMGNVAILMANVAAALDKTALEVSDVEALKNYAVATRSSYCAGCRNICEAFVGEDCRVGDVMRYLMYHRNYGDTERARSLYAALPKGTRSGVASRDFSAAERACPQGIPIGRLMAEAESLLV
ncbi:MAG: aldo/keto reductase [bacterium]